MARYQWFVDYGTTPTTLSDVQEIVIQRGRTQIQDPFKPATALIRGRNLASLPNVKVGDKIKIRAKLDPINAVMFAGFIADVQKTYGELSSMDTWEIACEDSMAKLGRSVMSSSVSWASNAETDVAVAAVIADTIPFSTLQIFPPSSGSISYLSAQNVGGQNGLQVMNQILATEQGYLFTDNWDSFGLRTRSNYAGLAYKGDFTDNSLTATYSTAKFTDVVFRSYADSYFTSVEVEPEGLAAQKAGTSFDRVYSMKSYDVSTTQAGNLAAYVKATLDVNEAAPSVISTTSEIQTNDVALLSARDACQGYRVGLILRNQRYEVFIEGSTVTATPEQTRFTFNVVSAAALNFFILDSATFGVLDTNKLGF